MQGQGRRDQLSGHVTAILEPGDALALYVF